MSVFFRTCRICRVSDSEPMHRYSRRHYAHFDCFMHRLSTNAAKQQWLSSLYPWQLRNVPYSVLMLHECMEHAASITTSNEDREAYEALQEGV